MLPFGFHTPEIVMLFTLIVWLWALLDCVKNQRLSSNQKFIWFLIILFTHFIGAVIYFIFKRLSMRQYMHGPHSPYYREQPVQYYRPFQTAQNNQPHDAGYAEGYRGQESVSYEAERQKPERYEQPSPYDQPLATYPEQMQQQ